MVRSPLNLPYFEAADQIVGACIECEDALRTALELLPAPAFKRSVWHASVFYQLVSWFAAHTYDQAENRPRLFRLIVNGEWPATCSARPSLSKPDRISDDLEALADLFCPTPGVPELIRQLCREITFPPLVLSPASKRTQGRDP